MIERHGALGLTTYDLYELAVQVPPIEARFLRAVHAGGPLVLAEDFSGPASVSRAWVTLGEAFEAIATDRDPEPHEHARERAHESLDAGAQERLSLIQADVLEAPGRPDVIAALNFALCELHTRERLVTYLRHALFRLQAGGVLVADLYGGADAMIPGTTGMRIETDEGDIEYVWEQREADPLTGRVVNAMHFELPDGVRVDEAFVYDWRLWGVPELRDAMIEAGFASTEVYADFGDAMDDAGELLVRPARADDLEESFVVYVVARV
jgi:hypothetical protein